MFCKSFCPSQISKIEDYYNIIYYSPISVFTIIKSFQRFPGKTSNFPPKADFKMQFTVYFVINFTQLEV